MNEDINYKEVIPNIEPEVDNSFDYSKEPELSDQEKAKRLAAKLVAEKEFELKLQKVRQELGMESEKQDTETNDEFINRLVDEEMRVHDYLQDEDFNAKYGKVAEKLVKNNQLKAKTSIFTGAKTAFLAALSLITTATTVIPNAKAETEAVSNTPNNKIESNSSIESYKPIVDLTLRGGQKVQLDMAEIERSVKNFPFIAQATMEVENETFSQEAQDYIVEKLGDKIAQGLLLAQEKGFEIGPGDTFHFHMLVPKEDLVKIEEKTQKPDSLATFKQMAGITKAIIFHCAEFPAKNDLAKPQYWVNTFQNRSISVDDSGAFVIDKTEDTSNTQFNTTKKIKGNYPNLGALAQDYNELKKNDFVDLGNSGGQINLGIRFHIDKDGVSLDKKLPKLKISFSKKEGVKNTFMEHYLKLLNSTK